MPNPTSKTGTVLLFLFASANTFADAMPLEHIIRDACSDQYFAQVDVQACVKRNADRSETVWHNSQAQTIAKIKQWDEEQRYKDAALQKYAAAEQSFTTYRNRYCDWAASLGGGAIETARAMRKNACIAEQNRTHAKQLQEIMKNGAF